MHGPLVPRLLPIWAMFSTACLACACRSTPAKESGSSPGAPAACPSADTPDPRAAWSERFPVERGGVVTMLGATEEGAKAEVLRWQSSYGLSSVETSSCGAALAVWIPGVDCPVPVSIEQGLARIAPTLFSRCFPPMTTDAIVEACAREALAARTCASAIPPLAKACRAPESARCKRLAELVARYAGDAG